MELSQELQFKLHTVMSKLDEIEKGLTTQDPMLQLHLREIHKALLEQEELVHVLKDEQIKVYMAGMMKYKNIKLIEEASATRKKGKVTADDL